MTQVNTPSFALRVLLGIAAAGLALFFMREASDFIVPLLLAWIIVLSASPLFFWLQSKKAPGWLAFVVTLLAILAVLGALVAVLVIAINRLFELLPTYADELDRINQAIVDFLTSVGVGQNNANDFAGLIDPSIVIDFYAALLGAVAEAFSSFILIHGHLIYAHRTL